MEIFARPLNYHEYSDISLREVRLRRVDLLAQEYVYEFLLKKNKEEAQLQKEIDRFQEGLSTMQLIKVSSKAVIADLEAADATLRSLKDTVQPSGAKTGRSLRGKDEDGERGSGVDETKDKELKPV